MGGYEETYNILSRSVLENIYLTIPPDDGTSGHDNAVHDGEGRRSEDIIIV